MAKGAGTTKLRHLGSKLAGRWEKLPPVRRLRRLATARDVWNMRTLEPTSRNFGFDRGTPVDRYYIESFLKGHAGSIRGRVLESGDARYTKRFGQAVERSDVLDISDRNRRATIIADLANGADIPDESFDCIILVHTLHYIFDVHSAVAHTHRALKTGGVVLMTLPSVSMICAHGEDGIRDHWRFTGASAIEIFRGAFDHDDVKVRVYGNVMSACAFLRGLAAEELDSAELDFLDRDYPVVVTVAAVKR
jgi:SAM-dependent methyltransferase